MKQPSLEGETGGSGPWSVLVGPGPRLTRIAAALGSDDASPPLTRLGDVAELLAAHGERGRVLLDAGELDPDDVGIVRRWLASSERRSLLLFADAAERTRFPSLREHERAHWIGWPGWLDEREALRDLLAADADLTGGAETTFVPAPVTGDERLESRERRDAAAMLADLTQRLELSLARVFEEYALPPDATVASLEDLERLSAFVHEFRAGSSEPHRAPDPDPARAEDRAEDRAAAATTFDLAALVAEKLEGLHRFRTTTARSGAGQRYELLGPESVPVRGERPAVAGALDTFLRLGRRCVGPDETIRARLSVRAQAPTPHVDVSLAWPAGPLARLSRTELLGPGQLEALFPDVSSADLRRAVERVESAGGRVDLRTDERGLLRITVRTTLATDVSVAEPSGDPQAGPGPL